MNRVLVLAIECSSTVLAEFSFMFVARIVIEKFWISINPELLWTLLWNCGMQLHNSLQTPALNHSQFSNIHWVRIGRKLTKWWLKVQLPLCRILSKRLVVEEFLALLLWVTGICFDKSWLEKIIRLKPFILKYSWWASSIIYLATVKSAERVGVFNLF